MCCAKDQVGSIIESRLLSTESNCIWPFLLNKTSLPKSSCSTRLPFQRVLDHTTFAVGTNSMQPAKSPFFCGSVNVSVVVNSLRYIAMHECLCEQVVIALACEQPRMRFAWWRYHTECCAASKSTCNSKNSIEESFENKLDLNCFLFLGGGGNFTLNRHSTPSSAEETRIPRQQAKHPVKHNGTH